MRREFLQLAKTYDPKKSKIAGWWVSEKLDGTRCFWDGGLSRGLPTDQVPWASVTDPKTGKRKAKIKPTSTGLWSRYGNPIMAPDWFLNRLPACPLDGELWAGRGKFQLCRSICGGDDPDPRFDQIQYAVYSSPPIDCIFGDGEINNSNMHCTIDRREVKKWVEKRLKKMDGYQCIIGEVPFDEELVFLDNAIGQLEWDSVFVHLQTQLPHDETLAREAVETYLEKVLAMGGEGVVIRNPRGIWTPKRVGDLLKYKPFEDDEATIIGFTCGRETDRGSKHLGMIGAIITDYKGKRLELSGLTAEEREFADDWRMHSWAKEHPGSDMPSGTEAKHFKVGQKVTFKYRELTDDGIPKEARYFRRRDVE